MVSPEFEPYAEEVDPFDLFEDEGDGDEDEDSVLFDDDEVRDLYAPYPREGHDWPVRSK